MKTPMCAWLGGLAALAMLGLAIAAPGRPAVAPAEPYAKPLLQSADSAIAVMSMSPMAPMR